jgi:hypothetical protein
MLRYTRGAPPQAQLIYRLTEQSKDLSRFLTDPRGLVA